MLDKYCPEFHASQSFYYVKVTKLGLKPLLNLLIVNLDVFSCINIYEIFNKNLRQMNSYFNPGPLFCASFPYNVPQPTAVDSIFKLSGLQVKEKCLQAKNANSTEGKNATNPGGAKQPPQKVQKVL